jgi:phage terminase large subunit
VAEGFNSRDSEVLLSGPAGSGKTISNLLKVYWVCRKYPGARYLITRKTRESLTESVLVTWERDVLGPSHPILVNRPLQRRTRQNYQFPNGSIVVLGGMDKPDKILSSEWDGIFIPEATDLELVDWETLGGRLRSGKVPYQQIIADCNPTSPFHWLYLRCQPPESRCTLIPTTHKDNPQYWDRVKQDWTPAGVQYVRGRLERMTGARRKRFLEGVWEAATGLVYEGFIARPWDAPLLPEPGPGHMLPGGWRPDRSWRTVWGIDWGESAPTVLLMAAVDPAGRLYFYREYYRTRLRPDELGAWAATELMTGREREPAAVVCDHDPVMKKEFEKGAREAGRHIHLKQADKADQKEGITQVQARFDRQLDGKARIFFRPDALEKPDPTLDTKPHCLIAELAAYKYDENSIKDRPDPNCSDHAADAMRYIVMYANKSMSSGGGSPYSGNP